MQHSILIHDYYSRMGGPNVVFLTIDTTLRSGRLEIKTFVKSKLGLPDKTQGIIFTPLPCEVVYFEPERVGVQLLSETVRHGKTPVMTDFQHLEKLVGYHIL